MIAGFKRYYRTLTLNKLNRPPHRLARWPQCHAVNLEIIIGRFTYRSGFFQLSNQASRLIGRWSERGLLGRWRSRGLLGRWRGRGWRFFGDAEQCRRIGPCAWAIFDHNACERDRSGFVDGKSFSAFDASMIAGFKRYYRTLTLNKLNRPPHRLARWPQCHALNLDIIIVRFTYRSGFFHLSNPASRLLGRWRGRGLLGRSRSRGLLGRWRGRGLLVLAVLAEQAGLGIAGGGALLRALLALAIPRRLDLFRRRGEPHREDDEGANHANEDREDQGQKTCI